MHVRDPTKLKPLSKLNVYILQVLFAISIYIGWQSVAVDKTPKWIGIIARFVVYLYLIRGSRAAIVLAYDAVRTTSSVDLTRLYKRNKKHWLVFVAAIGVVVRWEQRLVDQDLLMLLVAYLVVQYPDVEKTARTVTYGTGMACSFFEGYLTHIIPSDGHRFVGFEENIRLFEATQSVCFPVKRLFIVITKTMYCPPDLKLLDSRLEACKSLKDVIKDVAGVKNRTYRNSAYKVCRGRRAPVYVAVECATPLHTLHLVLGNRTLYNELDGIDEEEVVSEFMSMLSSILSKSPSCRNKCELVYYDNTDPSQSLADLLLDRIRAIEPNFEELIQNQGQD